MPTPVQRAPYLIVNPVAGRGRARARLPEVERFFEDLGLPLEVFTTLAPGHARRLTRALPPDASVLVLGGDGTLHEVAGACVGTGRTLGVLPAGSGDDFAFALGIPRHDLGAALEVVRRGRVRAVDTGVVTSGERAEGEVFLNAFGVGFDADVAHGVARAPRPLRERSAYLYTIVATLSRLRAQPVEVVLDARPVFAGPALLVSSHNGPRTGGSFLFATTYFISASSTVRWAAPRPGHMEGELLEPSRTFRAELVPRSLRVFAP